MKNPNQGRYFQAILDAVQTIFEEESENYISMEELQEGDNATDFMHALANQVPTYVYGRLTGQKTDSLSFNHIANRMCFQNSSLVDREQE